MPALHLQRLQLAPLGILALSIISSTAYGQRPQYANPYSARLRQPVSVTTPAMEYFGKGLITSTTRQRARQQRPLPQPLQVAGTKPFRNLQRGATISPYLGLDFRTSELSIPNYLAFVRPQQQQQLANKAQEAQVRRLKQQLRVATAQGIVSNNPSGGVPTTGHSAQFLNMGGYFPAAR
ncbi:MAG: hypothetical protein GXP26_01085 [Planctomycetes bacterium]|nr:hypothetical protein [Planctomycetota bacterium]